MENFKLPPEYENKTIIGKEYGYQSSETHSTCTLCEKNADKTNIVKHFDGQSHRSAFITRHLPKLMGSLESIKKYNTDPIFKGKALHKTSRHIEECCGKSNFILSNEKDLERKQGEINEKYNESKIDHQYLIREIKEEIFNDEDGEVALKKSQKRNPTKFQRNDIKRHVPKPIANASEKEKDLFESQFPQWPSTTKNDFQQLVSLLLPLSNSLLKEYDIFLHRLIDECKQSKLSSALLLINENYQIFGDILQKLKSSINQKKPKVEPCKESHVEKAIMALETLLKTAKKLKRYTKTDQNISNDSVPVNQKDKMKCDEITNAFYDFSKENFKGLKSFKAFETRRGDYQSTKVDIKFPNKNMNVKLENFVHVELHDLIGYKSDVKSVRKKQKSLIYEFMRKMSKGRVVFACDAASNESFTSCAFYCVSNKCRKMYKLINYCSVSLAEVHGIKITLSYIDEQKISNAVIYTDSLLACNLILLAETKSEILKIISDIIDLIIKTNTGIAWVPSHYGIKVNEVADELAKQAAVDGEDYDNEIFPIDEALKLKDEITKKSSVSIDSWSNEEFNEIHEKDIFAPTEGH